MSVLTAAVVGLGQMGRNHARVLQQLPGVQLVAVVDPRGDTTGAAGTARVHTRVDDLLVDPPDVAVVAVPTVHHAATATALLEAGVHLLVEKPVTRTLDEAEALRQVARRTGLVVGVGHIERFNPALRAMRERMEAGLLGEVVQVTTSRQGPFPSRVADVGVAHDLATHDLDLTRWVTGSRYATVSAQTRSRTGRDHEDLLLVTGRLTCDVVVSHSVNWLAPYKERRTVVLGERGALLADTLTADLTWFANGVVETGWDRIAQFQGVTQGDVTRFAIEKREPLVAELEGFLTAVRGGSRDGLVTLDEGITTLAVAEAVLASAAAGGVPVTPVESAVAAA